jgi:hypothetical protein
MTTTTAPIFMLKGDALVEFVNRKDATRQS